MKIEIRALVAMKDALQKLAGCDLPIAVSYELQKTIQIYNKEIDIYSKQKAKIVNKYVEVKDGKRFIPPEKLAEYTKEAEQLLDIKVNFPVKKIKISLLQANNVKMSSLDLMNLEPILESR